MARQRDEGLTETYLAAGRFVEAALRTDDSLFTPGAPIWTLANAQDLASRFVDAPDLGEGNFMEKLEGQLRGASDGVLQLAAEMLYVYLLGDSGPGGDAKRSLVLQALNWIQGQGVTIPPELATALNRGFGSGGAWATTRRPDQYGYLISFTVYWKSLDGEAREAALTDPWLFKKHTEAVKSRVNTTYMRAAVRYFAHPDIFEPIYSDQHRSMIVKALGSLAPGIGDQDEQLLGIRRVLEEWYGPIDFYDSASVLALWNPDYARWRVFLYWCQRALALVGQDAKLQADEIDFKVEIAQRFARAREELARDDPAWSTSLTEALRRQNNLINYRTADDVVQWLTAERDEALAALRALWHEGPDVLKRVSMFLERLPRSVVGGAGGRAQLVSLLLMAVDARRYPPFKPTEYQWAWAITEFQPEQHADSVLYARALDFLDQMIERGREQGVTIPDRLSAQTAIWMVLKYEQADLGLNAEEWQGLLALRGLATTPGDAESEPEPKKPVEEADPLASLAERLLLDEAWVRETGGLLDEKHQVIFYGPPGTGKTYVAQRLAEVLAGDKSRVRLVQFHPSYAYEDFVEGYRPYVLDNGQPGFQLKDGPLKRIASDAASNPSETYVLIIDEINRGNIAKVLGELYFLLEYRDEEAELLYSGTPFTLPDNLKIIGTMNTADRSIALMDAALRRRFGFVAFFPDEYPHQGLLRRWLQANGSSATWIADVLERLNQQLDDRNAAIGPSYFMRGNLDEAKVERIWRHEIRPQLEELFFDQSDRVAELSLEVLRAPATTPAPLTAELEEEADADTRSA